LKSRFYRHSEEIVKGATIEAVLLLQQYPLGIAENFTIAVYNISVALLKKQHKLLA
jgi:hypothetical protein